MSLRDELERDRVSELPIRDAICVTKDTSAGEAVGLMREKSLGCALIVDDDGAPVGLFSEQSLLELLTKNASLDEHTVGDFLDAAFMVVQDTDPITRVWNAIEHDGLRFIFVTDQKGKLLGVTGQRGLSEYLAEGFPQQVLSQRLGGTPWMQEREGA